jgi:hypothetical protein
VYISRILWLLIGRVLACFGAGVRLADRQKRISSTQYSYKTPERFRIITEHQALVKNISLGLMQKMVRGLERFALFTPPRNIQLSWSSLLLKRPDPQCQLVWISCRKSKVDNRNWAQGAHRIIFTSPCLLSYAISWLKIELAHLLFHHRCHFL